MITGRHELPPAKQQAMRRAIRLEWVTIAFLASAIALLYLVLGNSQAMKTAWAEDILSLTPPLAFLIASRVRRRPPNRRFPFGYHRAVSIAYLVASLALLVMGLLLVFDGVSALVVAEHPTIGTVRVFGHTIWLGWLMIGALTYTAVPPVILGRMKIPLAREIHDKVLLADADMNKADWLTAVAAIVGVIGIASGLWWLDPLAAIAISASILHDGVRNVRVVISDLMDKEPTRVDGGVDPLPRRVETELEKLRWVARARVRLREEGHVYFGDAFLVPRDERDLLARIQEASELVHDLDWRLHDVTVTLTAEPPDEGEEDPQDGGGSASRSSR